jgi:signal peptidase II
MEGAETKLEGPSPAVGNGVPVNEVGLGMMLRHVRLIMIVAAVLLVGCDHGTKIIAKGALEHRAPRVLLRGVFDLAYVENRDTGFGLLRAVPERVRTPALTVVQLVSGVAFLLIGLRRQLRGLTRICLLLVSAGAIGNGLDRFARGYVVDFLHIHHWPVFNVADIYITVGALLLILATRSRGEKPVPADTQPRSA